MAVVTVKSAVITNRDSTPQVKSNSTLDAGLMRESAGKVEVTAADTSTSKYILCQVPSNARISQLLIYSDDMGTATAADFGIYQTTENGGAVVDVDCFASALSLNGGALNGVDITYEAAATGVADPDAVEKPLWQVLALSADPKRMYDLVATLTTTSDVGGTLSVKLRYVV